MEKLNEFLGTAKMWKVWLFCLVLTWIIGIVCSLSFDLLLGGKIAMPILPISFAISILSCLSIFESRRYDRFYEVVKPFKTRAENCETIVEMNSIKSDLVDFYNNHSMGKLNNRHLNEIVNILEIKKPLLK